jgi:hypothetical protein
VPPLPRDLTLPYASPAEKAADWRHLLDNGRTLQEVAGLARVPPEQWPDDEAVRQLRVVPPIAGEATAERLLRWTVVFEAELSALDQAVASAVQAGGHAALTDVDLRSAVYLAERLLALLYDVPVEPAGH